MTRAAFFLSLLGTFAPALAQQPPPPNPDPEILGVRLGYNDIFKVGVWTPIEVTVRAGSDKLTGRVDLMTPDGDGTPTTVACGEGRRYEILPFQTQTIRGFVKIGQVDAWLRVEFHDERLDTIDRTFRTNSSVPQLALPYPMEQNFELWVGVGPTIGLHEAARLQARDDGATSIEVVELPDTTQLPSRWYGYDGVDWLVISTSRPEAFRQFAPDSAQAAALVEWVEQGGRVVICAGAGAPAALAPDTALAQLLSGPLQGTEAQQGFDAVQVGSAVETYADTQAPIPGLGSADQATAAIDLPLFGSLDGKVELARGERPLVVRTPRGFGQVVVVGLDLDRLPWAGWTGRGAVINRLLGKPPRRERSRADETDPPVNPYGVTDLSGQLSDGLAVFPNVRFISFWVVALLVGAYILLIGPGDYFLVKRVFKRMELTWLTSTIIVIGVSAGAYYLARWLKGDQLRINQIDIVDVDVATGLTRGTTWNNIFSPNMRIYDLQVEPRPLAPAEGQEPTPLPAAAQPQQPVTLFSWLGTPGEALGSMGGATPGLWNRGYDFSPRLDRLEGVPIQVWSTKAVVARWMARLPPPIAAEVTQFPDATLAGRVVNRTAHAWDDVTLTVGAWAYKLPPVPPGGEARLDAALERLALDAWVSGKRQTFDAEKHVAVQQGGVFDPSDLSVPSTVLRMMFYEASGGFKATQLPNAYQSFVDLSPHLALDQAILLVRLQAPTALLTDNDQPLAGREDQHWTYARFILPVTIGKQPEAP